MTALERMQMRQHRNRSEKPNHIFHWMIVDGPLEGLQFNGVKIVDRVTGEDKVKNLNSYGFYPRTICMRQGKVDLEFENQKCT